jgi:hypothetical protein
MASGIQSDLVPRGILAHVGAGKLGIPARRIFWDGCPLKVRSVETSRFSKPIPSARCFRRSH